MTNLEHLIENTLDAFSEGYTPKQIEGFIKTDMNFPEQPLTVGQVYEICQYVWCTYLDNGNRLKKEATTNGEKLIKEYPGLVAHYLAETCDLYGECESCPLHEIDDCGSEESVKAWLESDVNDTIDMS